MREALVLLVISYLLASCGGGGSGGGSTSSSQIQSGSFIDSPVEGLSYRSGSQSGITDSKGAFTYEAGQDVIFSIGGVTLGTVAGAQVLTPVELVSGSSSDLEVNNVVRFLLLLDTDNDGSNGISISSAVQSVAVNWQQIDFTTTDLGTALISIISDIASADNRTPTLQDNVTSQAHIESTLSCLTSGIFAGGFSGDDAGTYLLWIQSQRFDPVTFGDNVPRIGVTSGLVFSTVDNVVSGIVPQRGLSFDANKSFLSGLVSSGAEFAGDLIDYRDIANGRWRNGLTSESGAFSGKRKAGDPNALYRLSGFLDVTGAVAFSADGSGVIGLDIFSDNSVTGTMITLRGTETPLTGTLDNNSLITVTGNNIAFQLSFDRDGTDPTNDVGLGDTAGFVGSWASNLATGAVIGTSCKLN
ncbi:MAG TPA: hypothetical protein ENI67_02725 [Gammaproteobacteria bacterium]|nr:hypothetical protein [Gammaproteobacteria bacterium]